MKTLGALLFGLILSLWGAPVASAFDASPTTVSKDDDGKGKKGKKGKHGKKHGKKNGKKNGKKKGKKKGDKHHGKGKKHKKS